MWTLMVWGQLSWRSHREWADRIWPWYFDKKIYNWRCTCAQIQWEGQQLLWAGLQLPSNEDSYPCSPAPWSNCTIQHALHHQHWEHSASTKLNKNCGTAEQQVMLVQSGDGNQRWGATYSVIWLEFISLSKTSTAMTGLFSTNSCNTQVLLFQHCDSHLLCTVQRVRTSSIWVWRLILSYHSHTIPD